MNHHGPCLRDDGQVGSLRNTILGRGMGCRGLKIDTGMLTIGDKQVVYKLTAVIQRYLLEMFVAVLLCKGNIVIDFLEGCLCKF